MPIRVVVTTISLCVAIAVVAALALLAAPAARADDEGRIAVVAYEHGLASVRTEVASIKTMDPSGGEVATVVSRPLGFPPDPIPHFLGYGPLSWSPDAKTLAYSQAETSRGGGIFLAPGGQVLPQDNMSWGPAWSPLGGEIAYWAFTPQGHVLRTIHSDGSGTRTVAGAGPVPRLGTPPAWSPDGKTIAYMVGIGNVGTLFKVPAAGGAATLLVPPASDGSQVGPAAYAPDGKSIAFIRERHMTPSWRRLIVRELATGRERTVTETAPSSAPTDVSWSPDGKRLVYIEAAPSCGVGEVAHIGCDLITIKTDGTERRRILHADSLDSPAWSPRQLPNYYVKHIEVAQAIAPDLPPLDAVDALAHDPIPFRWRLPAVGGSTIPLVADKSTLVRVYVGDASLSPGAIEERDLRYSITGSTLTQSVENVDSVKVTAPDVAPFQTDPAAALNVWLPPSVARTVSSVRLDVELNTNEEESECDGCYPNGNKAFLDGALFEDGGNVLLAPVPIHVLAPDDTLIGPRSDFPSGWPRMTPWLPIGDSGLRTLPEPTFLAVKFNDLLAEGDSKQAPAFWPCAVLLSRLEELRLQTPQPAATPGAYRWVGFTDHPLARTSCGGMAYQPGRSIILTAHRTSTAVHELGHSLGLPHTLGYGSQVAGGAIALPYIGIGGVGYTSFDGGLEVRTKGAFGDIMSYSPERWTSPWAWHRTFEAILAESGAVASSAAARRPLAARGTVATSRSRRLVSGFVVDGKAVLIRSLVADAAAPANSGSVVGRIVARDRRGQRVATAKVRGGTAVAPGEAVPFMIGLPASKRIASLALLPAKGTKPLDRLEGSRHAPKARFVRVPRRASARKPLTVRWRASDRDRDSVSVTLLAKQGGQPWKAVAIGPARFTATVDPRGLGSGRRLRLRLLAADGFNTTATTTRPIALRR